MSNLIEQLRKARTAAEVAVLIPKMQEARIECQRRLDSFEDSREDAVLQGREEVRALKERVREEQDQLSDWHAAMRAADRRLAEFKARELAAELDRAATEAAKDAELRDRLALEFNEAVERAAAIRKDYIATKGRLADFAKAASAARRPELKPKFLLAEKFAAIGRPLDLPVEFAGWTGPMEATADFAAFLRKIDGKKAA